jgi:hypothetical protein
MIRTYIERRFWSRRVRKCCSYRKPSVAVLGVKNDYAYVRLPSFALLATHFWTRLESHVAGGIGACAYTRTEFAGIVGPKVMRICPEKPTARTKGSTTCRKVVDDPGQPEQLPLK